MKQGVIWRKKKKKKATKLQCDKVINISLCGTTAAPSNWWEQMEESSHPHTDNLLYEISPAFSRKTSWKVDINSFFLGSQELRWEIEVSLIHFTLSPVIAFKNQTTRKWIHVLQRI